MSRFVQFTVDKPCPSCGGVHQIDVKSVICFLNVAGTCHVTGRGVCLATKGGGAMSGEERLVCEIMALREETAWRALCGE